jgi:hypothetical protein
MAGVVDCRRPDARMAGKLWGFEEGFGVMWQASSAVRWLDKVRYRSL